MDARAWPVVALFSLGACSEHAGSPEPFTAADLCTRLNQYVCTAAASCGQASSFSECMATAHELIANCAASLEAEGLADAMFSIDAEAALRCLDPRAVDTCGEALHAALPACLEDVLVGTVASGGACRADSHCRGHARCELAEDACDGTCVAVPPSALHGACHIGLFGSWQVCEPGLVCDSNNRCALPVAENGACYRTRDCAGALVCHQRSCRPFDDVVALCPPHEHWAHCVPDDSGCDPVYPECPPRWRLYVEDGHPCGGDTTAFDSVECQRHSTCDYAHGTVCAKRGRDGDACSSAEGCAYGLVCDPASMTCVSAPGEGQPCVDMTCADPLRCLDGVCGVGYPTGADCRWDSECESRRCDDATDTCLPACEAL